MVLDNRNHKGGLTVMRITKLNSFYGILIISTLFVGCSTVYNVVSEDMQGKYDFRKVRWGYSQERVEFIEKGKAAFMHTPELLIYKSVIDKVPVYLVYTFRDNKLRAAGYMTQKPTTQAKDFVQKTMKKLGEPSHKLTDGMMWEMPKSIVYVDGHSTQTRARSSTYQRTSGVLELILKEKPEDTEIATRWDGVLTYIDRNFYRELSEIEHPLLDLTYYEQRLFGILRRRATTSFRTPTGRTIRIPTQQLPTQEETDR